MPLPTTNYATATLVNPTSALTDFTLMVDLSRMPTAWWAAVDTTDGTRGRAAKGDGTELAVDWIDFDSVNETGWARVKWSGTLATSGSQVLRVYPPKAANVAVAAGNTYGRHAAYDADARAYYPGGLVDRTSNENNLTAVNAPATAAGKVNAVAYTFNGSNQYLWRNSGVTAFSGNAPHTLSAWINSTKSRAWYVAVGNGSVESRINNWDLNISFSSSSRVDAASGISPVGGWKHLVGVWDGTTAYIYIDGVLRGTQSWAALSITGSRIAIGGNTTPGGFTANGVIDEPRIDAVARSAGWIAQEYDQSNNQAAFWGVWSDNPVSGGARKRAMVIG